MQLLWSRGCYHCKTCCKWGVCKTGKHRPHVVTFDSAELAGGLFQLARRCMAGFDVQAARFCPVLPRGPLRFRASTPDFPEKLKTLIWLCNVYARAAKTGVNTAVVKRQRFVTVLPSLLCRGVHLNWDSPKRYYFALRRAIVAALK